MKRIYVLGMLLSLLVSIETHAATCRLKTEGYGTFVGNAKTDSAAFELASEKCFDSLVYLKEKKSNRAPDEDQQHAVMNYCVNLSCE